MTNGQRYAVFYLGSQMTIIGTATHIESPTLWLVLTGVSIMGGVIARFIYERS